MSEQWNNSGIVRTRPLIYLCIRLLLGLWVDQEDSRAEWDFIYLLFIYRIVPPPGEHDGAGGAGRHRATPQGGEQATEAVGAPATHTGRDKAVRNCLCQGGAATLGHVRVYCHNSRVLHTAAVRLAPLQPGTIQVGDIRTNTV